jgi:uncharacterized membrane protein
MKVELKAVDGKSKDNTVVREIEGDNLIQVSHVILICQRRQMLSTYGIIIKSLAEKKKSIACFVITI